MSLPVCGRVAVGGSSAGVNRATALCQRLAGRRSWTSAVPTALSSAPNLSGPADGRFQLAPRTSRMAPLPILFCFLQDLNGDASLCQDLLELTHVPAELRRQHKNGFPPPNCLLWVPCDASRRPQKCVSLHQSRFRIQSHDAADER